MSNHSYWSDLVHSLHPYVPGEQPQTQNIIKLNTNENPYPPSPEVMAALNQFDMERLRLYPDPESVELKKTIAAYHALNVDQVFVGNGSDEVLALAFMAFFFGRGPILFPDITYSFYPVYCQLYQIEYKNIPLDDQLKINVDDYAVNNSGVIFPNPNAPTGRLLALEEIERLLQINQHAVVIVDEAYIDFGGVSADRLVNQYKNLLVIQTFSKSRSLAGMRLGYALGHENLIEGLLRVKNSFNSYPLDRLAQEAGRIAIADEDYFKATCNKVVAERERMVSELEAMGFEVLPSAANFVFAKHSKIEGQTIYEMLKQKSIYVRHFNKPRINDYVRITVGRRDQVDALITALKTQL